MKQLPAVFTPDHPTAGLDGYPAKDFFGAPGEKFTLNVRGRVHKISGKPCKLGGEPGKAYGQSVYVAAVNGDDYFLTHIDRLFVSIGQEITPTTVIGTMCDSAVSHKPGTTHIHEGRKPAPKPKPELYDVTGPKGNSVASNQTRAKLEENVAEWASTHPSITVRRQR